MGWVTGWFAVLLALASSVCAAQPVYDVSKAKADDLLALSGPAFDINSPAVRCTLDDPRLASDFCNTKTRVTNDEAKGKT